MTLVQCCFLYLASAIVILAVLAVTRKNPVYSVLFMLILFVHIAVLYLFLNAEFMAAIQIIVYAGAVLVLYLFVVMFLNIREEELQNRFHGPWPLALFGVIMFAGFFVFITKDMQVFPVPGPHSIQYIEKTGSLMAIGSVLFTEYLLPFEIASILLLVAIIGAVVLTKRKV
ncbi:MAG TPA: NADH-quinone oxidoreductase subunit J [Thermodesulfovibrionia bacterium]|nr:NADH-quinone oxidoreductase subunit J [Thermodesulfovibrionia bacterium]